MRTVNADSRVASRSLQVSHSLSGISSMKRFGIFRAGLSLLNLQASVSHLADRYPVKTRTPKAQNLHAM